MKFRGRLQQLAVARLPDLQERPGIQAPLQRPALLQPFLKGLADEVLFQTLSAGVLQNAGEPKELLAVQLGQRIL